MSTSEFPPIQPGGSLILAWQITDKHVVVVGGGEVAAGRIYHCLNASAKVTVICPPSGLHPEVRHRISQKLVTHIPRVFQPSDLDTADMVLVAVDDPVASTVIWKLCKEKRIPANIADVPSECDFYFGAVHRDGPLQIMVSTNGRGPRLAARIRRWISERLPNRAGDAIGNVGKLREKLRKVAPKIEDGPVRMKWMSIVSDKYGWEELGELTEEDMTNLLTFYPKPSIPEFSDLLAMRKNDEQLDVFEGSFGFSVGI